jgi:hypothetical protein
MAQMFVKLLVLSYFLTMLKIDNYLVRLSDRFIDFLNHFKTFPTLAPFSLFLLHFFYSDTNYSTTVNPPHLNIPPIITHDNDLAPLH